MIRNNFNNVTAVLLLTAGLGAVLFPSSCPAAGNGAVEGVLTVNSVPASGAIVYLSPLSGDAEPPAPMDLTIDQKDKAFAPDWSVVTVGSRVLFENHDEEMHNIKSISRGNRFDLGVHLPGTVKTIVLKNIGPVLLRCRIHDNMKALIFVSPTPYFAETGSDGRFRLSDVPKGDYRITAWHPRLTEKEAEAGSVAVTVSAGPVREDLNFRARAAAGADLTEVANEDWGKVLDQIRSGLEKSVRLWKAGKSSSAMLRVLTTHSQFFGESGLSSAISQHLGKSNVDEHERRFNDLVRGVQRNKPDADSERILKKDIDILVERLRKDIEQLPGSM